MGSCRNVKLPCKHDIWCMCMFVCVVKTVLHVFVPAFKKVTFSDKIKVRDTACDTCSVSSCLNCLPHLLCTFVCSFVIAGRGPAYSGSQR